MRRGAALLCLLVLGACNRTGPVAATPQGPPPGTDGRYRGTARLVTGDRMCPRSGPRVYEVRDGVVTLAYSAGGRRRVPLTATVAGDGRVQATDGQGTIEGQLTDGTLEVTIRSAQCEHRWTLRRVP